jgi:hypothetical protein
VIYGKGPGDIDDKAQAGEASRPSAGLSLTAIATRLPGLSGLMMQTDRYGLALVVLAGTIVFSHLVWHPNASS